MNLKFKKIKDGALKPPLAAIRAWGNRKSLFLLTCKTLNGTLKDTFSFWLL